jgi:hypothetical protein
MDTKNNKNFLKPIPVVKNKPYLLIQSFSFILLRIVVLALLNIVHFEYLKKL